MPHSGGRGGGVLADAQGASPQEPWQAGGAQTKEGNQEGALDTLTRDLGSADDHTRNAAQELLARVPYQKRAWLRQQAEATSAPEARAALEKRLGEIEEMLATNPPPISLHVKQVTLLNVVDALNQEMGTHLTYESRGETPDGTYTLDVTDQPFWEVMTALDRQRPFRFDESYGEISLTDGREFHREPGMSRHMIAGPFFMFAVPRYEPVPNVGVREGTARPDRFEVACKVFADPRMNVVDFALVTEDMTLGPDTKGNPFKITGGGGYLMGHAAVSGRIVSRQFEAAPARLCPMSKPRSNSPPPPPA